ncbi:sugar ABC transporter substrate-binding protein [Actinomyces sp. MRS3W]|uniref:ABC transporter substrate-binding protein n=1 Tax=Actinomyces sp. MRS3W TaxID=2800796 RepID=UPI0028FD25A7|nr:sugar ABC transporter substrate-binding protein [Actinomyces sp. MRS3W]MDU0349205.1 sugar ABC transporter substrate-binding protein [Actinomyces sp. MRS3W]
MFPSRRTFLGLGATAAAAATLAACSSQQGSSGSGSASSGSITLWTHNGGNPEELAVVKKAVDAFNEANPDTPVDLKDFPQASYNDSIAAAAVAGDLPDILDLDGPIMPNWAWAGYLAPLQISSELENNIIDSAKGYWNDTLYSVGPYDTSLCFLGRKSAFEAAGIPVPTIEQPWTKDEFDDALAKLAELPDYDYAIDFSVADTAEWWPYAYAPMLQSFGGDLIDRETFETAEGFLNGPEAVAWGEWFRSCFEKGYASETPATDGQDFLQGKVPLYYAGGWKVLQSQETFGEDEVLILPPVDFGHGAKVGGGSWQWGVSATSSNPTAANAFIEFLMQDEYLVEYSNAIGNFPSVASATPDTDYYGEGGALEPVYEIGTAYALLRPATPGYKVISSIFDKAARDIVSGADVQSTLDQAVKDIDADITSNNGYQAS